MNKAIVLAFSLTLAGAGQLMAEEPPAPSTTPAAATPAKQGVTRAVITSGIKDREPVDDLTTVGSDVPQVYLFTELRDMQGEHITHRWQHEGKVVSEVGFDVKGQRWRVWSNKTLPAGTSGAWKVDVVNSAGEVLTSREFTK